MRLSSFAYRLLLLAFPADVRREFGDDMAQMFAMQVEEARQRRRGARSHCGFARSPTPWCNGGGERFKPGERVARRAQRG